MKSIFTKLVVWSCGTFFLSLVALFLLTVFIARRSEGGRGPFPGMEAFELVELRKVYETTGPGDAAAFLARMDVAFGARYYFLDGTGQDVLTGQDRSALLASAGHQWNGPVPSSEGLLTESTSNDGKYHLMARLPPPFGISDLLPYSGLILLVIGSLSWPLAANIGAPLRTLATVVDHFGEGDVSARLHLSRHDEIGHLAESYNRMADRIETLLIAERRLLQDVSHELRSPLARLSFAAELARTAPDRDAAFRRVRKEVSRLNELIGALLEVTRNEGDPSTRTSTSFALDELLREVVEDCRLENADRNRGILLLVATPAPFVGNRELIRRAVENILRNAMRYAPEESKVEVALTCEGKRARIQVRDFGPGVPDASLTRIFQPFFRVDDSRNDSTGGSGLGLSIALRAVKLHGGEIRAANALPGFLVDIDLPVGNIPVDKG